MASHHRAAPWVGAGVAAALGAAAPWVTAAPAAAAARGTSSRDWPGFRGPAYTASVEGTGVFDGIKQPALKVAWSAPAGSGYSGVAIVGGRAYTAFATPKDDVVAAFDAATGREVWRTPLGPTHGGHDGSHDGPIATPAADGRGVYALGPRGRLVAFEAATGAVRWSNDLSKDEGAVTPFYGFATSPPVTGECVIVQHAIKEKQALACFDRQTGKVRWTAGKNEVSYQSPVLATLAGQVQLVVADEKKLLGIDPATGKVLWEHDPGVDGSPISSGSMVPLVVEGDQILLTPKQDTAAMLQVKKDGAAWSVVPLWTSKGFRTTYSRPVYHKGYLYGYAGTFLACVDAKTGEIKWRSRAPGDGFVTLVDGRLVIQTKNGSLHVAEASADGYKELAQLQVFPGDHSWTEPSVAAGRLFVRGMTAIASVSVVDAGAQPRTADAGAALPLGPRLSRFLDAVAKASDKGPAVDAFLAGVESFPLIEGDVVEFLYRGTGRDLGIASDILGARVQEPMRHVEGTDLFYWTARVRPRARLTYRFVRDLDDAIADPRNPRKDPVRQGEMSWFAMPGWEEPAFLAPAPAERKGRLVTHEIDSARLGEKRKFDVYLPAGYDTSSDRLPVVYVPGGKDAVELGALPNVLDNLIGRSLSPTIVVFVHPQPPPADGKEPPDDISIRLSDSLADEVAPFVDRTYRTRADRAGRALYGAGFAGHEALHAAFSRPEAFSRVATQSAFMLNLDLAALKTAVEKAKGSPDAVHLEWSNYDLRADHEGWSNIRSARELAEFLRGKGVKLATREVDGGFGWGSWRTGAAQTFEALRN
jgi:enterochelin esterase-like enzyme/outer membrane protein assembly factor BamB